MLRLTDFVEKVFETPSVDASEWFGYYNYDTLNYNQTKMLCNKALFDGVSPKNGMCIELGYYDIPLGKWNHIGYSDSWNWQQGAMLQWIPGRDEVIYNKSKDNRLVSIIHNIKTKKERIIDWPIYCLTPDGKKSISLDLERSYWCRAYHYKSVVNKSKEGRVYWGDGIFEIDLDFNKRKCIISIDDIISYGREECFKDMKHWLEHVMVSPDGSRFCFLHRYSPINNIFAYKTRVFIANIDGSGLQMIKGSEKFNWTHFGWAHNNDFCIYTYKNSKYPNTRSLREIFKESFSLSELFHRIVLSSSRFLPTKIDKKLSGRERLYQYYSLMNDGNYNLSREINNKLFCIDGHPSFSLDDRYIVTDTYPDSKGFQHLIVFDMVLNKGIVLADFYAYYSKTPASCDLHPKLCMNNNYIVVDTAYDDKHHMIMMRINWEKIREALKKY